MTAMRDAEARERARVDEIMDEFYARIDYDGLTPQTSAREMARALAVEQERVNGPSGLLEQLKAARTGEQIEHRLRVKAEERVRQLEEALTRRDSTCAIHGGYDPDQRGPGLCPYCVANARDDAGVGAAPADETGDAT